MSCTEHTQEKLVECPFNKSHKVKANYLQFHIVRCMKQYPTYTACPYNACHRVDKKDLAKHMSTCPDQHLVTPGSVKSVLVTVHGNVNETPIHVGNPQWNTEDEDWSKDL